MSSIQGLPQLPVQKADSAQAEKAQVQNDPKQKEFDESLALLALANPEITQDQLKISDDAKQLVGKELKGEKLAMVTEASVTGLKPWSKDWVTEGLSKEELEQVKPLIQNLKNQEGVKDAKLQVDPTTVKVDPKSNLTQGQPAGAINGKSGTTQIESQLLQDLKKVNGVIEQLETQGQTQLKHGIDPKQAKTQNVIAFSGDDFITTKQVAHRSNVSELKNSILDQPQEITRNAGSLDLSSAIKNLDPRAESKFSQTLDINQPVNQLNPSGVKNSSFESSSHIQSIMTGDVDGHVVKGSMARDRLSSESLGNLSSQIGLMKTNPGGGEIRLRLKPESLGEVKVQVNTVGDNVNLKIVASDIGAKNILEESLGFLKESLSNSNISLTKVEVGTSQNSTQDSLSKDQFAQGQSFDQWNEQASQGYEKSADDSEYGQMSLRKAAELAATSGLSSVSGSSLRQEPTHSGRVNTLVF